MASGLQYPPGAHPRRPPAHQSVSLVSSPRYHKAGHAIAGIDSNFVPPPADVNKAGSPFLTLSRRGDHHHSLGESSNIERWFEQSNNNITQSSTSFPDNNPPFFLRNSSSSRPPAEVLEHCTARVRPHSAALPHISSMSRYGTRDSSSDDFRSVIDDLTIENKKLRRRLRKYEKVYDAHLQEDRLFEVRIHKLRAAKRRELEDSLRKFVMNLEDGSAIGPASTGYAHNTPPLEHQKTISSYASTRFADSAYASMAASGRNSSTPSGHDGNRRQISEVIFSNQQKNVHSDLHDIPTGLLPEHQVAMSEKDKKELVVRRLEQLFAGKEAAAGGNQRPLQQQEIAHQAAKADWIATEARGEQAEAEGVREARIMPKNVEDTDPCFVEEFGPELTPNLQPTFSVVEQDPTGEASPDQRPTRPSDLDPHRAQIPAENMEYIRHLGFLPPDVDETEQMDGHGWIYLNLIINMAQLHTINVTTEFVKKAIAEYSTKFELSDDGRKIRWKGGHDVTRNSSKDSPEEPGNNRFVNEMPILSKVSKKRKQFHYSENESLPEERQATLRKTLPSEKPKQDILAYTPLFFHKEESDGSADSDSDVVSDSPSNLSEHATGDLSGLASRRMRTPTFKRRPRDDGPIIFYDKAKFCTDLSGDPMAHFETSLNTTSYNSLRTNPVGSKADTFQDVVQMTEPKGRLTKGSYLKDSMDVDDGPELSDTELSFAIDVGIEPTEPVSDIKALDFAASSIGGVHPQDNFAINVQCRQVHVKEPSLAQSLHQRLPKSYPAKIMQILAGKDGLNAHTAFHCMKPTPTIRREIISAQCKDLPPSTLPPPSFFPFGFSDSEDDNDADSELESDLSNQGEDTPSFLGRLRSTTTPQPRHVPLHSTDGDNSSEDDSDERDDGDDDDSDASLDFLATARELDPVTIHVREREYDSAMAEQLAEQIPAVCSAATAGGWSGISNPVGGVGGRRSWLQEGRMGNGG